METAIFTAGVSLALLVYAIWLLVFPILLYTGMGEMLQELKKLNKK
ncbi:hypothetical protein ACFL2G_03885 [Candidatus Omnitrophota bacterium]